MRIAQLDTHLDSQTGCKKNKKRNRRINKPVVVRVADDRIMLNEATSTEAQKPFFPFYGFSIF